MQRCTYSLLIHKSVYRLLFCDVTGWWYVACNGIEGWAPATYLEKINLSDDQVSDSSEKDEIPCMAGGYTITNRCMQLYICMRIAGELFVMCRRCGYRIA